MDKNLSVVDNIFRQYLQVKEAKDNINQLYEITKATAIALLNDMKDKKIIVDGYELHSTYVEKETPDEKQLSKWLIDNDLKNLLNVVYKPNMELINGVFSSSVPKEVRDKCFKDSSYYKIKVHKVEES